MVQVDQEQVHGYVKGSRVHRYLKQGPDCANFPTGIAEAPVGWNYHSKMIDLMFKAGFVGATQNIETGTISPVIGWFMQHDDKK